MESTPPPNFGLFLIHYSHKIFNNTYLQISQINIIMVLYTAGIQLLTRIYNVLVLFIEGEKSKSEFLKETNSLNIYFLEIWSNSPLLIEQLWFTIGD